MAEARDNTNICSTCGNSYKHERNLRTHEKTHTGTLPFSCCEKEFASRRELIAHRCFTHGEEKSHVCAECGKSFARASELKTHEEREGRSHLLKC